MTTRHVTIVITIYKEPADIQIKCDNGECSMLCLDEQQILPNAAEKWSRRSCGSRPVSAVDAARNFLGAVNAKTFARTPS